MKLIEFVNYEHYVEAQRRTLMRRGVGPYFTSDSIKIIANWLKLHKPIPNNKYIGICHGARNGYEADEFKKHLPEANIIGTDLFPFSGKSEAFGKGKSKVIKHDFSAKVRKWIGRFDFVFSNSLDHARDPVKTLSVWLRQLNSDGYLFIHWSSAHRGASGGDCFGADLYEYIELMNSVGELIDLLYCKINWNKKDRLQRRALESVALVVKPKGRK